MAPSPPFTPTPPDVPGSRIPTRNRSNISDDIVGGSGSAEIILTRLRSMIAAGRQDRETILGTIAVAAQALTGAGGAAMAMPRDGEIVCVGRSGEIAPELGDRLSLNSGISGECLRTGTIMRCDDAARDFHVDPEVCRQMGVQSIGAVPLRAQSGRVGVLEVFAAHSYAFTDEHMELLFRLAGLAETAWAQTPAIPEPSPETVEIPAVPSLRVQEVRITALPTQQLKSDLKTELPAKNRTIIADPPVASRPVANQARTAAAVTRTVRLAKAAIAPTKTTRALTAERHAGFQADKNWRYGIMGTLGAVFIVLLALFSWKAWYKASLPVRSARAVTSTQQEEAPATSETTAGAVLAWSPAARRPASKAKAAASPRASVSEAEAPPPPDTVTRRQAAAQPEQPAQDNTAVNPPVVADSITAAPDIQGAADRSKDLERVLSTSPSLPKLDVPVSQGIAGGVLVHKVLPVYPPEARDAHVHGTVVLDGMVTERGQVEDLKLVSGHPVLAKAAMDAVKQWRYTPYLLNGKPIRKQTRINIDFIAPR